MTGKVFIFLGIILTLFHVLLFYKKYLEIPESKILIDSNDRCLIQSLIELCLQIKCFEQEFTNSS